MTNAAGASVWSAVWLSWGGAHTITGAEINDARFPGQWFQLEAGLHYNWHRAYDPTIGRFTQSDPMEFVDGPSLFAYAGNSPFEYVDPTGRYTRELLTKPKPPAGAGSGGGSFPWPSWTKPKPVPVPLPGPTLEPQLPTPDEPTTYQCHGPNWTKRCKTIHKQCKDGCLGEIGKPGDPFPFFNCVNKCLKENGCPSVAD